MNIDNTIHNLNVVREALEAEGLTQHVKLIDEAIADLRSLPVSEGALTEWFQRNASDDQPAHLIAQAFAHDFDVRRK